MTSSVTKHIVDYDIHDDHHSTSYFDFLQRPVSQKLLVEDFVDQLDIADGLKQLLISHGFSLKDLLNISHAELSEHFGIDNYVSKIIISAIKKAS
jgi:hypothetical protein